ncbi:MAG: hypothetical protein SFY66_07785 [Oculatellaceae cyanobacterium bins.114]|nr:hypothetical protein [Oculatellaceae cyanobacterium bins.114]
MPRRKRNSIALKRAERRKESICSIHPQLDLGGGLTVDAYTTTIDDLRVKLAVYNTALSTLDKLANDVDVAEQATTEMSEKMLLGIGSRYGKTSQEYEMAGGSRRNRRRSNKTSAMNVASSPLSSSNGAAANGSSINGTSVSTGVN